MTVSPPVGQDAEASTAKPLPHRKPAVVAAAAVLSAAGLTAGIVAVVGGLHPSAVPPQPPPGPQEAGGVIDTVPADGAEAAEQADLHADERPSPASRETASADPLPEWLDNISAASGVPRRALLAYANAQLRLMEEQPRCRISWPTLAAIGEVESKHGTYAGGKVGPDGRTTVDIIGIPLDGSNNTVAIGDTDGGDLDGDTRWDRAVGPMQFIPTTWEQWGADADGDGRANPHDIDDTALSAARYLCAEGRDLTDQEDWWRAVLSYNQSESYARDILDIANRYAADAARAT
ncbi:lytic transglycosylase domain-containing protein [Nocardiopsis rhodophaea]|uniref:lytic transglycosylase domain-containing protein n=2 Tax=Nocardiopsis rhodophaea TaxID=280238 RepID=UPI0031D04EC6